MCKKFNSKSSNRSEYKCHNYYFSGLFSAMIRITLEISWFSSVFPASFDIWLCSNKVWQINARGFSKVRSSSGNISWGGTFFFFFWKFCFPGKSFIRHIRYPEFRQPMYRKRTIMGYCKKVKNYDRISILKMSCQYLKRYVRSPLVVLGYLTHQQKPTPN